MNKAYIFRVFIAYLVILATMMLLRTEAFLHQLQALAEQPVLIFSLGFMGLIVGLALLFAQEVSNLGRVLGLLITLKSICCVAFPVEFCHWLLLVVSLKLLVGLGIFYLVLAFNLWLYSRFFLK